MKIKYMLKQKSISSMNARGILLCLAALPALCGCFAKETPVCDIEVSTERETYAVGESVVFNFSGKADNIVFYSGEPGHSYDRKGAHFADNPMKVKFRTATDGVLVDGKPDDNFRFLVSTDFNGVFDAENVSAAKWTDLTDSFGVATEGGLVNTDSKELDLKELLPETAGVENPVFYLAFRYFDKNPDAPVKNRWVVRTYSVKSVGTDGEETVLADKSQTMGWQTVSLGADMGAKKLWSIGDTQVMAEGQKAVNYAIRGKDEWLVSKAFYPDKVSPDSGEVISFISISPTSFSYSFSKPGVYNVAFDCSSVWYNGGSSKLIRKTITITE